MSTPYINWHSAMLSALKIELADYRDILTFQSEIILNAGSRRADFLLIKASNSRPIDTPIGRIFLGYNLIEYKGPEDTMNILAFYKAKSYLYSLPVFYADQAILSNMTLTLITHTFPRKLWYYLNKKKIHPKWEEANKSIAKIIQGLYYVYTEEEPLQLIITSQLPPEEYLWLRSLTGHLKDQTLFRSVGEMCKGHENEPDYKNYLNTIIRANHIKKEDNDMFEAVEELFAEEWAKERAVGVDQGLAQGIPQGINSMSALMNRLLSENRVEEALRATSDPAYRDALLEEFHLL